MQLAVRASPEAEKTVTIEKGKDWGRRGIVPPEVPLATSDPEIADLFTVDDSEEALGLSGPELIAFAPASHAPTTTKVDPRQSTTGLASTLGARGGPDDVLGQERTILPLDLGVVTVFGKGTTETVVMSSSLVIASKFWSGEVEGAMNSSFLGEWNVTPSGHPNDGRFDVVMAKLSMSDRLKARKRLPSGSHVPHPDISIRRLKAATFTPAPSAKVWIDGRLIGPAAKVEVVVFPDSVELAI